MKDFHRYTDFLERYAQGVYTESEHIQFLEWFSHLNPAEADEVLERFEGISSKYNAIQSLFPPRDHLANAIESRLDELDEKEDRNFSLGFWRYAAAAAVFILIGAFAIYTLKHPKMEEKVTTQVLPAEAGSGSNKAILTLSDGSNIVLDDSRNGEIAVQQGITITKTQDGKLIYQVQNTLDKTMNSTDEPVWNTITTPKAGQFKVNLPDGTLVWLNSLSSIRFPAHFNGPIRQVEITGEVYFEVASLQNKTKGSRKKVPFHVVSANQVVEVLGTHFNINSYRDEGATKTTLLEGSVKVRLEEKSGRVKKTVQLRPGEQARLTNGLSNRVQSKEEITVQRVDSEEAVAWKNGYFKFKDADIQEVMRQFARWYDIEVTFKGDFSSDQFTGFLSREIKIANALKILQEGGGVKFNIKGKQVEVVKVESN